MKQVKEILVLALFIALFIVIGFGVPYVIQFKFNFFGATMVTLKDILGLWIGTPMITFVILLGIYAITRDN